LITAEDVKRISTYDGAKFDGVGWVAGGLGFCDADGWKSWETRWWNQPFCWTAGAYLHIGYREGPGGPNGWNVNYSVEFE
jgi:hypothetical protein